MFVEKKKKAGKEKTVTIRISTELDERIKKVREDAEKMGFEWQLQETMAKKLALFVKDAEEKLNKISAEKASTTTTTA